MPPPAHEPTSQPVTGRPGELLDRFLARLIDGIILAVVYFVLTLIFSPIFLVGFQSVGELFVYYAVVSIIWVSVAIGYFAFLESSRGQTFGKMALKLQTFGPNGGHPTMEQAIKRNSFYAIQLIQIVPVVGWFLGPLASLAAVIMIAVGINNDTARRQAWHDNFAGGTYVLKVG